MRQGAVNGNAGDAPAGIPQRGPAHDHRPAGRQRRRRDLVRHRGPAGKRGHRLGGHPAGGRGRLDALRDRPVAGPGRGPRERGRRHRRRPLAGMTVLRGGAIRAAAPPPAARAPARRSCGWRGAARPWPRRASPSAPPTARPWRAATTSPSRGPSISPRECARWTWRSRSCRTRPASRRRSWRSSWGRPRGEPCSTPRWSPWRSPTTTARARATRPAPATARRPGRRAASRPCAGPRSCACASPCTEACRLRLSLSLKSIRLGTARGALRAAGAAVVTLRLSRAGRRALIGPSRLGGRATLVLRATATDSAGNVTTRRTAMRVPRS